jgi:hypothetical protein
MTATRGSACSGGRRWRLRGPAAEEGGDGKAHIMVAAIGRSATVTGEAEVAAGAPGSLHGERPQTYPAVL